MNQLRDILCTSCSDVALSVDENDTAEEWKNMILYCEHCEAPGTVEQVDDGEQAMLVFRVEET